MLSRAGSRMGLPATLDSPVRGRHTSMHRLARPDEPSNTHRRLKASVGITDIHLKAHTGADRRGFKSWLNERADKHAQSAQDSTNTIHRLDTTPIPALKPLRHLRLAQDTYPTTGRVHTNLRSHLSFSVSKPRTKGETPGSGPAHGRRPSDFLFLQSSRGHYSELSAYTQPRLILFGRPAGPMFPNRPRLNVWSQNRRFRFYRRSYPADEILQREHPLRISRLSITVK